MQKGALENQNRAPENSRRLQSKNFFTVADLGSGMWKVAPENKMKIVIEWGMKYDRRK